jgi:hypothetical protein
MPGYGYSAQKRANPQLQSSLLLARISNGQRRSEAMRVDFNELRHASGLRLNPAEDNVFLSHPQFSPSSSSLAFFIRRKYPGVRLETQMLILDMLTGSVSVAETGPMVSHFCWISDESLLAFFEDVDGKGRYGVFARNGKELLEDSQDWSLPAVDGHPSYSPHSAQIVTDTYPDRQRMQHLYLIGRSQPQSRTRIASLHAPFRFRDVFRADLHPRFDRQGNHIAVDCSFPGLRSFAVIRNPYAE